MENVTRNKLTQPSNRREEIIQAAAKLFYEKGYNGTSIGDIAKAVALPKGGLYHYIKSKEELLYEVTTRGIRAVLPTLREIKESRMDPKGKFIEAIEANVTILANYKEYVSVLLLEKNALLPEHYQEYVKNRDEVEWIFRDIIQEGVDREIFREVNVKMLTLAVLGMCRWVTQWFTPEGELQAKEIAAIFADAAERMLRP